MHCDAPFLLNLCEWCACKKCVCNDPLPPSISTPASSHAHILFLPFPVSLPPFSSLSLSIGSNLICVTNLRLDNAEEFVGDRVGRYCTVFKKEVIVLEAGFYACVPEREGGMGMGREGRGGVGEGREKEGEIGEIKNSIMRGPDAV